MLLIKGFYICFYCSHRPVDVHNIYNQVQVKLLMQEDEQENIPAFEDVFREDEEEEDEAEVRMILYWSKIKSFIV